MPWAILNTLSILRSGIERAPTNQFPFSLLRDRFIRYRNTGDYFYAARKGWMDVYAESSLVFADFYRAQGLPAIFVPWGSHAKWHADLGLERDIDVLWMGSRRTRRRSELLERVRAALAREGYRMYLADGVENPFIYDAERTRFLNRSKLTLSVLAQAKHDNIFHARFHLAAPNRSLLVTEQELPHCPVYVAGKHYVAAQAETLTDRLLYYLQNEPARREIVENAYALSTTQMTLGASVRAIMAMAERARNQTFEVGDVIIA